MPDDLTYTVRRSDRARSVRVRVEHDGEVTVTLPRRAREREAAAAVRELRPWIDRRLADAAAARAAIPREPGTVPYLGGTAAARRAAGAHARAPPRRPAARPGAGPEQRAAIERWFRRAARAEVAPAPRRGRRRAAARDYERLTIRDQRTRWGSCSATGAIAINWRLLLGPEEVLDYVDLARGLPPGR